MPYVALTPLEVAACIVFGFLGLVALCLALIVWGIHVIERERDEHKFRRELRLAERYEGEPEIIVQRVRRTEGSVR